MEDGNHRGHAFLLFWGDRLSARKKAGRAVRSDNDGAAGAGDICFRNIPATAAV